MPCKSLSRQDLTDTLPTTTYAACPKQLKLILQDYIASELVSLIITLR